MSNLLKPSSLPSFLGRKAVKGFYYWLLGPLYRRIRAEVSEEIKNNRLAILEHIDNLLNSANEEKIGRYKIELQQINSKHIELVGEMSSQISDEFVKLYKELDDIKNGRADINLNTTIVDELIKIHKGIEEIKHTRNGKQ
ncbi:MAG: hypothetical protein F6K16_31305 [Symploca sp. SIO2B6]|nr:hypothetical protein [Symploca sp. SIO2B6]